MESKGPRLFERGSIGFLFTSESVLLYRPEPIVINGYKWSDMGSPYKWPKING